MEQTLREAQLSIQGIINGRGVTNNFSDRTIYLASRAIKAAERTSIYINAFNALLRNEIVEDDLDDYIDDRLDNLAEQYESTRPRLGIPGLEGVMYDLNAIKIR